MTLNKIVFSVVSFSLLICSQVHADHPNSMNCDIWQDEQKISHILASQEHSGMACLGYLHGRDRTWQMDFFRKIVQGRKSEVIGYEGLKSDFFLRLLGLAERAEALYSQMPQQDQKMLEVYTAGVNRGMKQALKKGVYEFQQQGSDPEPWRAQDSISLMFLQSFDQTRRTFETQINQEKWEKSYSAGAAALFDQEGLPWTTSILKKGEYSTVSSAVASSIVPSSSRGSALGLSSFSATELFDGALGGIGMGSNNWVIHSKKSQSGHAWLANDPHLSLSYPAFWYWVHLNAGRWDAIGASFPGVPFIVSGSNRHVSWGLTNSFLPVSKVSYVPEEDLAGAVTHRPVIWIRFWKLKIPFFFKTFRRTLSKKLPILPLPAPEKKAMVLRWSGFDLEAGDFMGMLEVMGARSAKEADESLKSLKFPSWNFVFADDQGNIGYRAVGRIPRFSGSEMKFGIPHQRLVEVENSEAFARPWVTASSSDEMPHVLNPKRGFVVSANNLQWPADSVLYAGQGQITSFRAFRIEELLGKNDKHDLNSNQRIQCDVQAVDARFLLPEIVKILETSSLTGDQLRVVQKLKDWNYETNAECEACGVFRLMVNHLFDTQNLNPASLYRKLRPTSQDHSLKKAIIDAFELALKDLKYDDTKILPQWSTLHLNAFAHWGGSNFSPTRPIATPGDDNTVNYGLSTWNGVFFNHTDGASHRLIVEMSQPPKVYSVLAGENLDTQKRDITDPHSEWQKWIHCDQQRRVFPVDWSKIEDASLERIAF